MVHVGNLLDLFFGQVSYILVSVICQGVKPVCNFLSVGIVEGGSLWVQTFLLQVPVCQTLLTDFLVYPGVECHACLVGNLSSFVTQSTDILPELRLPLVRHTTLHIGICRSPGISGERSAIAACAGIYQTGFRNKRDGSVVGVHVVLGINHSQTRVSQSSLLQHLAELFFRKVMNAHKCLLYHLACHSLSKHRVSAAINGVEAVEHVFQRHQHKLFQTILAVTEERGDLLPELAENILNLTDNVGRILVVGVGCSFLELLFTPGTSQTAVHLGCHTVVVIPNGAIVRVLSYLLPHLGLLQRIDDLLPELRVMILNILIPDMGVFVHRTVGVHAQRSQEDTSSVRPAVNTSTCAFLEHRLSLLGRSFLLLDTLNGFHGVAVVYRFRLGTIVNHKLDMLNDLGIVLIEYNVIGSTIATSHDGSGGVSDSNKANFTHQVAHLFLI